MDIRKRPDRRLALLFLVLSLFLLSSPYWALSADFKNAAAIEEILSGTREVANAAWWGFDEEDSTAYIQAAIDSGAKQVLVPHMSKPWIVRPIQLAGNQELILEEGVVIAAKRGEFRGKTDSLFNAKDIENLKFEGYGARLEMQKDDYIRGSPQYGKYEKAEWRSVLNLRGCKNVQINGLTLSDSGGDGIYVVHGTGQSPCENITIRDVVCDNNYRQGMSIISAKNLLVENSVFKNTGGTPPSSGIDIQPNDSKNILQNILIRNCRFEDNDGDGIEIFPARIRGEISIQFEDCLITSSRGDGIRVVMVSTEGPRGLVEFRNCTVENTAGYGIKIHDKAKDQARVRFVNCKLRNVGRVRADSRPWTPIWLQLSRPDFTGLFGGIDFESLEIEDTQDRPWAVFQREESESLHDVQGTIRVRNPYGAKVELGEDLDGVELKVEEY